MSGFKEKTAGLSFCFCIQSVPYHRSCSFWKTPLHTYEKISVKKTTSAYYYENNFDLEVSGTLRVPGPHFENLI